MSKKRRSSLGYQAQQAFKSADGIGTSKHKHKQKNDGTIKIFSHEYKEDLYKTSKDFCKFIKNNHSEVRYLNEIKPIHIQSFLENKAKTCSQSTLDKYNTHIKTLGKIFGQHYGTLDYKNFILEEKVVSDVEVGSNRKAFTSKEMEQINNFLAEDPSYKKNISKAIFLSKEYGLRVHELVGLKKRDVNLNSMQLNLVETKGGRPRTLQIKKQHQDLFRAFTADKKAQDKVLGYKNSDSLSSTFKEVRDKIFNDDDSVKQKNFHALRKVAAQNFYNEKRMLGNTVDQALGLTSEFLGHNFDRDRELIAKYVENIW